jgi:hypothetical protein
MTDDVELEERVICLIAILVLAPVVIIESVRHVVFDGGSSLCLLAVVLGAIGLAKSHLRAARQRALPPARAIPDSQRSIYDLDPAPTRVVVHPPG